MARCAEQAKSTSSAHSRDATSCEGGVGAVDDTLRSRPLNPSQPVTSLGQTSILHARESAGGPAGVIYLIFRVEGKRCCRLPPRSKCFPRREMCMRRDSATSFGGRPEGAQQAISGEGAVARAPGHLGQGKAKPKPIGWWAAATWGESCKAQQGLWRGAKR